MGGWVLVSCIDLQTLVGGLFYGFSPAFSLAAGFFIFLLECLRADDREPSMLDEHTRRGAIILALVPYIIF